MIKSTVLIAGSSGHSKVIIDIFEKEGILEILGLLDTYKSIGEETLGYKVIGKERDLPDLLLEYPDCKLFVAIGDNWVRYNVVKKIIAISPGIKFASAIHPSAQIGKNVIIGHGVAVMAGAVINSDSNIGDFTIINTNASVDHDNKMHSFSSLAPNATTGGNVTIGEFSAVAIGATIKNGLTIGSHSVIGAGALLLRDCGDYAVMYGYPAKFIRTRKAGENYLR